MSELPATRSLYTENFELKCFWIDGFGKVPMVDGWVQFSLTAKHIPSRSEQESCLRELAELAQRGKAAGYIRYWHFLRKHPGLKIRWQVDSLTGVPWLVQHICRFKWAWLGQIETDSVFGQRELLQGHYTENYGQVLDLAASEIATSPLAKHPQDLGTWVELTCYFMLCFIPDSWLAWEALGRFERMRTHALGTTDIACSYYCPMNLLEQLQISQTVLNHANQHDKPILTGTLMLLNYVFNIWGIDAVTQAHILELARLQLRPEIAGKDIP